MATVRGRRASLLAVLLGVASAACATGPAAPPTGAPAPSIDPWRLSAGEHRADIGEHFVYDCPPNGSPSTIWGTDVYTDDSSVCTAAVHAGLITFAEGGQVSIEMRPGQDTYASSERNGVESSDYGSWGGSYVFVTD